jgi:hypothetical protein
MNTRNTILAATVALFTACSDDNGSVTPDSRAPDSAVADMSTGDGPGADGPITTPDSTPVPDGDQKPDKSPPPPDQGPPPPDGPKTQCYSDKDCKVFEDCCSCQAVFTWENMPSCKMACTHKACTTKKALTQPEAYCLTAKGKCFLGDSAACSTDADCKLVNDCCSCMAVPVSVTPPNCPMTCLVDSCTSVGLQGATAVCLSGKCRLKP